mmetsp:Transcript_36258/g.102471  ORF Transcript_36258/g.102471 Transcript_36258/m.102471 type:complete len:209 (-) Transcript_36258:319-945(-)
MQPGRWKATSRRTGGCRLSWRTLQAAWRELRLASATWRWPPRGQSRRSRPVSRSWMAACASLRALSRSGDPPTGSSSSTSTCPLPTTTKTNRPLGEAPLSGSGSVRTPLLLLPSLRSGSRLPALLAVLWRSLRRIADTHQRTPTSFSTVELPPTLSATARRHTLRRQRKGLSRLHTPRPPSSNTPALRKRAKSMTMQTTSPTAGIKLM